MTEQKWDSSLVGFFENESKYGTYYQSGILSSEQIEEITSTLQEGGKLKFRLIPDDKRKKLAAYLDFITPDKVAKNTAAFKANREV